MLPRCAAEQRLSDSCLTRGECRKEHRVRAAAAACEGVDENSAALACECVDQNARAWTTTRGNPDSCTGVSSGSRCNDCQSCRTRDKWWEGDGCVDRTEHVQCSCSRMRNSWQSRPRHVQQCVPHNQPTPCMRCSIRSTQSAAGSAGATVWIATSCRPRPGVLVHTLACQCS